MSSKPASPSAPGTSGKPRSIHDAGSPDTRRGPKPATNPDGATPAELPSTEAAQASLHKPRKTPRAP